MRKRDMCEKFKTISKSLLSPYPIFRIRYFRICDDDVQHDMTFSHLTKSAVSSWIPIKKLTPFSFLCSRRNMLS